jgi:LysR family glycine cleavage system transcriptional activator
MRTPKNLPPLPALRVFECVGRVQSFRKASEELCISQSAVSYHIKTLEDDLGLKMFERHARGISFTPDGATYFGVIRQAFGLVEDSTLALRGSAEPSTVKVSVLPSFAAGWLVQRLARFAAECPHIRVMLDPGLALADLDQGEADVAIRYGRGDWAGVQSELLFTEHLSPVASPELLRRGPAIERPQDVLNHPLLFVSRPYDWELWAEACGVDLSQARCLHLTEYNIVLQAATDGLGVAMGRKFLIAGRLKSGTLVKPLAQDVTPTSLGYWVCLAQQRRSREAQAFAGWLMREARRPLHSRPTTNET